MAAAMLVAGVGLAFACALWRVASLEDGSCPDAGSASTHGGAYDAAFGFEDSLSLMQAVRLVSPTLGCSETVTLTGSKCPETVTVTLTGSKCLVNGDQLVSPSDPNDIWTISVPTGAPSAGPTPSPTATPTPLPTAAPKKRPTGSPTGVTGDPHVTNVEGQRFDLVRVGVHELLRLPRRSGSPPGYGIRSEALLEVLGTVESERKCEEPFVKQLDLSGLWLQHSGPLVLRAGDLSEDSRDAILLQVNGSHVSKDELIRDARLQGLLTAEDPQAKHVKRRGAKAHRDKLFTLKFRFSGATLTVDWIHREVPGSSLNHLDFHVADLPKLEKGMDVGGILGRDDHTSATMSSPGCQPSQNLLNFVDGLDVLGSLLGAAYQQ